jgi:hypothetical protein
MSVTVPPDNAAAPGPDVDVRPGLILAALLGFLYVAFALGVNYAHVSYGFHSDESTYYMMAHSLAKDGDLVYQNRDLRRVWQEFPSGPTGLFLKKGRTVHFSIDVTPPFLHLRFGPDPDTLRLYYGKSFAYPFFAAPFVWLAGTNGFMLFHGLLLALVALAAYLFLNARSRPVVSALVAGGFLVASVVPAYTVWMTPEVFNFAVVFLACFVWLYKEVSPADRTPRGARWLLSPRTDLLAAVLVGIAAFSKPPNVLVLVPILALQLWRRRLDRAIVTAAVCGAVLAAFFGANMAISGDWNFQGGERNTYVTAFPFLPGGAGFDDGLVRRTNEVLWDIIFDRNVFWTNLTHNLLYFFAGRHSGLLPYFFPAVFALALFVVRWREQRRWQYLVLGVALVEILVLIIWIPYDYFGGGGVLGNRYFMNWYGLFFFLLPPIRLTAVAVVPWIVGMLFTAQLTLNPFYSAFYPAEHSAHGPLRWLPVELTLINTLPMNTSASRVRVPFALETPRPFSMYFLDTNAYPPIRDADRRPALDVKESFWVRGEARAECIVRAAPGALGIRFTLTAGDVPNDVTVKVNGASHTIRLKARQETQIRMPLGDGFPLHEGPRLWVLSIASRTGFVPMFTSGVPDVRFLGVRVHPELIAPTPPSLIPPLPATPPVPADDRWPAASGTAPGRPPGQATGGTLAPPIR